MNSYLENFGVFAILFFLVYAYKKVLEYYEFKQSDFDEDEDIHK